MDDTRAQALSRFLVRGALWGVVAAVAMAMEAMLASAALGQGFLTPLYGIASPLVGGKDMMASMMVTHVNLGPLLLGAVIHLLWGALYGVVFALLARQVGLAGPLGLVAGIVYGLVVLGIMALVVLPLVGAGGMPRMVGFSFGVEHIVFGMVLGLWPLLRPAAFARVGRVPGLATR
ncbi:MAG TPA: hypothetical protein VFL91_28695 [Thermomicrobiales bacterium]|nr:hypothetical protein [Thermomicrobiales bacterium]